MKFFKERDENLSTCILCKYFSFCNMICKNRDCFSVDYELVEGLMLCVLGAGVLAIRKRREI